VKRGTICFRIDSNSMNAELATGALNAKRNLTPIGYEDFLE
jgi:hypothetical protein